MKAEPTEKSPYRYSLIGLVIESCFPIPELYPADGPPDVVIRYGGVPSGLEDPVARGPHWELKPGEMIFEREGVARYWVRQGREIIISRSPEAEDLNLKLFLFGSGLGALCHMRGLLPLHACAVALGGKGYVFMGPPGSGKSTLAGALFKRGCTVFSDDIAAIAAGGSGPPLLLPGIPEVLLWPDAARQLEEPKKGLRRARLRIDKGGLGVKTKAVPEAVELQAIFRLDPGPVKSCSISPIKGAAKTGALIDNTYRFSFLEGLGLRRTHFNLCSKLAGGTPLFRLERPSASFNLRDLTNALIKNLKKTGQIE